MDPTDDLQRLPTVPGARPKYGPIAVWCAITGIGRSKTYELLSDGTLRAIKVGGRLLIDVEHGLSVFEAMPHAKINVVPRGRRRTPKTAA